MTNLLVLLFFGPQSQFYVLLRTYHIRLVYNTIFLYRLSTLMQQISRDSQKRNHLAGFKNFNSVNSKPIIFNSADPLRDNYTVLFGFSLFQVNFNPHPITILSFFVNFILPNCNIMHIINMIY